MNTEQEKFFRLDPYVQSAIVQRYLNNLALHDEIHYPYLLWNKKPLKEEEQIVLDLIRSEEEEEKIHERDPHNLSNHDFVYDGDPIGSKFSCNFVSIIGSRMVEYSKEIGAEATPPTSDDEGSSCIYPDEIDVTIKKSEDNNEGKHCVQWPQNSSMRQDVRRVIHILFI